MSALPSDPEQNHARCILALDLGTKCGYALRRRDGTIVHGTEVFTPRQRQHEGQRWVNFRAWLGRIIEAEQVHVIAFERVVFAHSSASASDVYGGFLAHMQALAAVRNIECVGVAVPTVKKHWTGSGRADKGAMIAAAKRRGFRPNGDNAADALAVLSWACEQEGAQC